MYEEQIYLQSQSGTARLDKFTHSLLVKSNLEVSPPSLPLCNSTLLETFQLLLAW